MADISGQITLNVVKSGVTATGSAAISITMSGTVVYSNAQTVGFGAAEAIELGADIGDPPAIIFVKNTDATNYIELALDNGMTQKFAKLLAGQSAVFPPSTKTMYAQANTGACVMQVVSASL